jgi:hypothetical protein
MTPTVQLAPAASEATHVPPPPVVVKSEALPPTNVGGRVSVTADEVLFVSVTNRAVVGVATSCVPKARLVGETEMVAISGRSATYAFVAPVAPRDV